MQREMKAAWIEGGRVELRRAPLPRRRRGEALIRVEIAGICNTDLELQRGYYGFSGIPGHEFVGEVVEGSPRWQGRRVVGEINLGCGRCSWCGRSMRRHCPRRKVLGIRGHGGALAEYITLPEDNLHAAPENLDPRELVFCEPLAAACEILDQVRIPRGARTAVLGDGKLGLLVAQVLGQAGADVTVFGRHEERRPFLLRRGIRFRPAGDRPRAKFPFVVEATGSAAGLGAALDIVEPRGTVVLKSTVHGKAELDSAKVVVDELVLIGSRCGRFEPALRLLERQEVDVMPLIHAELPLDEVAEAFRRAAQPGALKVLVRCSERPARAANSARSRVRRS
ncbi:MAG: alcohol dehydrogenase catalytic domain-containing protein [Bryobacteraceae bacterium]|nr:alcohol dehydrogenase catalytic domain-containing protein [Bryobacteraceae bacterium]